MPPVEPPAALTPRPLGRGVDPGAVAYVRMPSVRHTLKDEVYARICDALMTGEFTPGERLTVRQVADLTRTSVMPVREAFRRLTSEGALEPMPSGATRVPTVGLAEFREITTVRLEVEGLAARLAASQITADAIDTLVSLNQRVVDAVERRDVRAETRANEAFHFTVYRASGSPTLVRIIEGLWLRIGPVLVSMMDGFNSDRPSLRTDGLRHHFELVDALRQGDAEASEVALRRDLGTAADFYVGLLAERERTAAARS